MQVYPAQRGGTVASGRRQCVYKRSHVGVRATGVKPVQSHAKRRVVGSDQMDLVGSRDHLDWAEVDHMLGNEPQKVIVET